MASKRDHCLPQASTAGPRMKFLGGCPYLLLEHESLRIGGVTSGQLKLLRDFDDPIRVASTR